MRFHPGGATGSSLSFAAPANSAGSSGSVSLFFRAVQIAKDALLFYSTSAACDRYATRYFDPLARGVVQLTSSRSGSYTLLPGIRLYLSQPIVSENIHYVATLRNRVKCDLRCKLARINC